MDQDEEPQRQGARGMIEDTIRKLLAAEGGAEPVGQAPALPDKPASAAGPRAAPGQVTRRRVFYIPGYDPFPPRRYRELYRTEGAAQAALSGYAIALRRKPPGGLFGWRVVAEIGGTEIASDFSVLVWSDIVRGSMRQGILASYLQLLRTAWVYLSTGALWRLMRLRKGPVIAALYPVAMLSGQLALAGLLGWAAGVLVAWPLPAFVGWIAGLAVAALALRWFHRQDGRFYAYYLMHDYAFSAQASGRYPAALEARLAEFRAEISAALQAENDEVLVVGHSSGAHLAVSVLADLLRDGRPPGGPALSLLTLGQVVPMQSFLPRAGRLRADLHDLAGQSDLTWVDVTAPGDGCAFALCDPVAVSGVAPKDKRWPLVISAAFTRTLSAERWRSLRWRFFRLHFQYLCAFDNLPGATWDYDYFRITAGPRTLAAHFAGRPPSQSRIDVAVSGHTDMTA